MASFASRCVGMEGQLSPSAASYCPNLVETPFAGRVRPDSSAHSSATLAALGVAPLVSQTLGLVDGRAPDVMPAIRARSADGWPTLRGDEAGFADGAPVPPPALQPLAELHTAGACHKVSLSRSRLTSDHCDAL